MDFIGIDVGTSGCKASVISETGIVKKSAQREYRMIKHTDGRAALSLSAVWESVKQVLKEISAAAGQARAAAVSSLGETAAFLDDGDRLLIDEGILYADRRNHEVWKGLKTRVPEKELYEITGKTKPHIATVNQYNYWAKEKPKLLDQTRKILCVDSFIAYMLCGEAALDYSSASNTLVYDINTYQWNGRLAEAFGIDLNLFPEVVEAGSRLGKIRKKISEELGLPRSLEILAGCHDQISAAVGGGASEPGDAVLGEGSTEALNLLFDARQMENMKKARLPVEPFVGKGRYLSLLSRLMHGSCIRWFAHNFDTVYDSLYRSDKGDVYDDLNRNCAVSSGGIVFLPYFSGTYFSDVDVPMGAFIGMDTSATVYQMYRALLEGLSCETRELFRFLQEREIAVNRVTASGGASKSPVYMQIKANITEHEICTLQNTEAGISGLAILCAVKMGCYTSISEAARQFVHIGNRFVPQEDACGIIARYQTVSAAVRQAYRELGENGI